MLTLRIASSSLSKSIEFENDLKIFPAAVFGTVEAYLLAGGPAYFALGSCLEASFSATFFVVVCSLLSPPLLTLGGAALACFSNFPGGGVVP